MGGCKKLVNIIYICIWIWRKTDPPSMGITLDLFVRLTLWFQRRVRSMPLAYTLTWSFLLLLQLRMLEWIRCQLCSLVGSRGKLWWGSQRRCWRWRCGGGRIRTSGCWDNWASTERTSWVGGEPVIHAVNMKHMFAWWDLQQFLFYLKFSQADAAPVKWIRKLLPFLLF